MKEKDRPRGNGVDRTAADAGAGQAQGIGLSLEDCTVGFLFFSLALSFSTITVDHFTLPKLAALRTATLLLFILWAYRLGRGQVRPVPKPVFLTVISLGAWWVLTTFYALHRATALGGNYGRYNGLWTHILLIILFLIFASMPVEKKQVERTLKIFLAALTPVSVYALVQFFGGDPISWTKIQNRSASTVRHPVILGALLGLALPFILSFFFRQRSFRGRLAWGSLLMIFLAGFFSTVSRGPLVGLLFSFLLFFLLNITDARGTRKKRLFSGLAILLILAVFTAAFFGGIHRDNGRLVSGREVRLRLIFYETALKIIRDHPWAGVGFENFRTVYPRYRTAGESAYMKDVTPTMVHNGYLQTAATNGLPSLVIYILFLSWIFLLLFKDYRERRHRDADRLLSAAFAASLAGFLIQDLSGWPDISLTPFFWILLGLAVSYSTGKKSPAIRPGRVKPVIYLASSLPILLLALLVYGGLTRTYADHLLWKARQGEMTGPGEWRATAATLGRVLRAAGADYHYLNAAGRIHAERFAMSDDPAEYGRSAALLEKAHRQNPFDPYILVGRVDLETLALERGAREEPSPSAESAMEKMIPMDRNNPTVHAAAARLRVAEGRLGEALELLENARSLRPRDKKLILMEGEIHLGLGDYEKAIEIYRTAVSKFQEKQPYPAGWLSSKYGLAFSLARNGDLAEALAEIDSVIEIFPEEPYPLFIRGNIHQLMGDTEKAG